MSLYKSKVWCVYIVRRDDGKLYTGITSDLRRRLRQHARGAGARFLRCAQSLQLMYRSASAYDYKTAAQMEYNLKRKRDKYFKLRLIKAQPQHLHQYLA
ncbi:unknown [Antheraea pernyi nucleopolyhedrovirus]|uniref:Endonuclease n=2 Tax=Antheraea pernyi nuclear polyhedrosis virus TaxID=161494 RepID=Q1HH24_NPVAP|nr:hypothetical protein APNV_p074 [Antheraea pernyi nucleopolyhedrovirus]AFY62879.1 endonuclease [Philosamia cynthia ricini nucleopolyhedrovirus virus]AWD33594.1 endonuclease [Antheraea proylei nucleopolyhedrovirus]BBD50531.1 endonuclease [Antheraea yamamai nucleopolyhedrovirus]BBD50683.1 endonuclease [Samia cynthia nucleopolyhedrovirus]BBD51139.1 endonuclease [Samia ricini nucleopolyhedrovirus]